VGQGWGIGFLYYDAVKAAIERGSFKLIQIPALKMEGQTYIVYHNQRPLSHNAQEFLKLLRQWRDNNRAATKDWPAEHNTLTHSKEPVLS
jgi:DNA-binding transcriptional LysR family regulator